MKKKILAQETPQCRYHECDLKLHTLRKFIHNSLGVGHKTRKYWRCPVSGCPWVASCGEPDTAAIYETESHNREWYLSMLGGTRA